MNKKENRMAVRQSVEKTVIRDEQNRRIQFAATNPIKEVLKKLHTTLRGLDAEAVHVSRGRCVYQPLYSHSVLSGSGINHYRYDSTLFFSVWQYAGGF